VVVGRDGRTTSGSHKLFRSRAVSYTDARVVAGRLRIIIIIIMFVCPTVHRRPLFLFVRNAAGRVGSYDFVRATCTRVFILAAVLFRSLSLLRLRNVTAKTFLRIAAISGCFVCIVDDAASRCCWRFHVITRIFCFYFLFVR